MKKLKKIVASLMALGMVSTMGIFAFADTIEDTQKTFYTGDVNLDGNVNILDLLSLKKMILGITPLEKMYIDGDTLKKVEATQSEQVTIQATEYTVDVENNIIHVTGIGDTLQVHDLTLKVTDNTTFSGNFSNLEEVAKKLEEIKGMCIDITYNSLTKEISTIAQISVNPITIKTIQTNDYVVDLEENLIKVKVDTISDGSDTPVYLLLKVTDDTVFGSVDNLEELSHLSEASSEEISITYHTTTQEIVELDNIIATVEPIILTTVTSTQDNFTIDIDAENSQVKLIGTGNNELFKETLNITYDTEITRNDETLTLEELAKITDYQYIIVLIEYNEDTKEVTKISLMDINGNDTDADKTIHVCNATDYVVKSIEDNSITIYDKYTKENITLTTDDNTLMIGGNSLADFYKYAINPDKYDILITYDINTNIITDIYLIAIPPEPTITMPVIQ